MHSHRFSVIEGRDDRRPLLSSRNNQIHLALPFRHASPPQSHYSVGKSASLLGLGLDNVVKVETDAEGRMIPKALREAVAAARAGGGEPFFVGATSGTTVLGAFDPLDELADVCRDEGLWLHCDVSVGRWRVGLN